MSGLTVKVLSDCPCQPASSLVACFRPSILNFYLAWGTIESNGMSKDHEQFRR